MRFERTLNRSLCFDVFASERARAKFPQLGFKKNYVLTMIFAFTVLALIGLILIIVLPIWPFSRGWGYGPAVVIGIVFLMLLAMTLTGRIPGIGDS